MLSTDLLQFDITSLPEFTLGKDLSQILNVGAATLHRYQRMAKILIEDYRETHTERLPLTRYQCWVLIQINDAFKVFKNKKFIVDKIKASPADFSKYAYRKQTGFKH
ncbi:hypothetical protein DSM106972_056490 [Dulcicalothrix desertica PCC 7102]|uniref:Uncharacterized protein n=1 Tax=Dulcicalothrix desertica PCC 7102 TaxID=232991 RepID=A0A433V9L1_9CYAN|nr:hypothetical protein [Dulcicalothrix desertica]RUT02729.1 hypothetical protein DSM106972_056490 [Dulcicalothrix desertica PCC 7102]TWH39036.1 hypothetical protein CAL7102_08240 [Dulcicalothrix desertica PCC 7102]